MKTIFLYVPGILTVPGHADNWTGRAVTATHNRTNPFQKGPCQNFAEKVEYLSSPLTRPLWQRHRANKLARTLSFYSPDEWRRVLVGHSNGCDVILDALAAENWPVISELHLIAGACSADFQATGLLHAQERGDVGRVFCYTGGRDLPLKAAGSFFGRMLGFGTLGSDGPSNYKPYVTHRIHQPDFGHSSWFKTESNGSSVSEFDLLMTRILLPDYKTDILG